MSRAYKQNVNVNLSKPCNKKFLFLHYYATLHSTLISSDRNMVGCEIA